MTPAELLALADAATPGPWEPIFDPDDEERAWIVAIPEGHLYVTPLPSHNQDGLLDADARLIALAPDLARLVAEFGEALEDLSAEGWFASWSDDPRVLTIRAALAKLSELEVRA